MITHGLVAQPVEQLTLNQLVGGSNPPKFILKLTIKYFLYPWACGEMVDTLVLGTNAQAWEFESLHAHHFKKRAVKALFYCSD